MFHSDFLPMLKNNLRLCQILKCVPFEFDSKTGRLIKAKSFGHILLFRVQCVLSVMYIAALFLNLCFGPLTTTAKFQGFTFFMVYFVASWMKFNYSLDMAGTQVIHTFLDFEKYILKGKVVNLGDREHWGNSFRVRISFEFAVEKKFRNISKYFRCPRLQMNFCTNVFC